MVVTFKSAKRKLVVARAAAINAYAGVEQQLLIMFMTLTGLNSEIGGMIFFRIVNTRSRNAMMEELLAAILGKKLDPFQKSLFKIIGYLDSKRNEIVHWHLTGIQGYPETLSLVPPKESFPLPGVPAVLLKDLETFIETAGFIAYAICWFSLMTWGGFPDTNEHRALRDKYLRSPIRLPVRTHPLFQKMTEHFARLRSSRR